MATSTARITESRFARGIKRDAELRAGEGLHQRRALREIVFLALRCTLLPALIRLVIQRNRVTIITYHAPSDEVFETHVTALMRIYNFVSLSDYVEANRRGDTSQLPRRALIVTLDDGHRSNYALKRVIAKYKVPVTIFVCSGLVDTRRRFWFLHDAIGKVVQHLKGMPDENRIAILREAGFEETAEVDERQALSRFEIDELKANVDFQSHTVLHPILPQCTSARAETEIRQSKEDLERNYALSVYAFAFPNGDYSERELGFVEKAGYQCALTLDRGFNSQATDRFRLRRICIPDDAGHNELIVKTSGMWQAIDAIRATIRRRWPW